MEKYNREEKLLRVARFLFCMQVNCFIMSKSFFIPVVLVILVMFVPGKLKATGLAADAIYINGEKWDLYAWPINKLYSGRLQDFLKERVGTAVIKCTMANPFGYNCTWEIRDGKMYLKEVVVEMYDTVAREEFTVVYPADSLKGVFRESCTRKGICADWVSGDLIAGKGKLVAYAHMGFNRTAEHQVHLKVEKGKVVESSLRRYRKTGGIEKIRAVTYTTLKRNFCEAP
jgi:hypothetical protein